ncbi:hypothetical protein [Donghicola tyrosinivorans]|uniref:Uncharacterized protein n=1 Tax=Donghicola tyrosinivorans TaxID=1652492 RepID=A0A2T0WRT0_9RHOB|nr:hypothetical protein [Donghicola tyrosinivorans]PRY89387.1 hypothetical protein CLV74_10689 [Donghicola tyrosinivorans]
MSDQNETTVRAIWQAAGWTPPEGDELSRAAEAFHRAAALGRGVPRTADKTISPMLGPRDDIKRQTQD